MKCLVCESPIAPFVSYGKMPLANNFLRQEDIPNEYFFELKAAACPKCAMVQLTEQPEREKMFNKTYAFFSQTSSHMARHFQEFAESVMRDYMPPTDPFVVEIGSNDGTMLINYARKKIRHLGVEPSDNVAQVARDRGVNTVTAFFEESQCRKIVAEHGQADAIVAANVMCHIPYVHSIAKGVQTLLKPGGIFAFEDPYLGSVLEKTSYDQWYDAHVFLFSVTSIRNLFAPYGMEVVDAISQPTHGGSMRYVIAHQGTRSVHARVAAQLAIEEKLQIGNPETYRKFAENCEKSRKDLRELLQRLKKEGKRVVGYAATAKSTTVTNYCQITPDLVEYISDSTPIKQGKLNPGMHIPVVPPEKFRENYPDYAILFGWNHFEEIMAKEKAYTNGGGKWILYVPRVHVLGES